MLNITNYYKNVNQNHNGIPFTPIKMSIIKKHRRTSAGQDVKEWGRVCTAGWNVKWCSHCEKGVVVPQKLKLVISYDPKFNFWVYYPNECKMGIQLVFVHSYS